MSSSPAMPPPPPPIEAQTPHTSADNTQFITQM